MEGGGRRETSATCRISLVTSRGVLIEQLDGITRRPRARVLGGDNRALVALAGLVGVQRGHAGRIVTSVL